MPLNIANKKQALTRIRPIQGQLNALEHILADSGECGAVLQRLTVIRGAINGLMLSVLGAYLQEQFATDDVSRAVHEKSVDDTIAIMRSYLR